MKISLIIGNKNCRVGTNSVGLVSENTAIFYLRLMFVCCIMFLHFYFENLSRYQQIKVALKKLSDTAQYS